MEKRKNRDPRDVSLPLLSQSLVSIPVSVAFEETTLYLPTPWLADRTPWAVWDTLRLCVSSHPSVFCPLVPVDGPTPNPDLGLPTRDGRYRSRRVRVV